jgi:hypothetical protein
MFPYFLIYVVHVLKHCGCEETNIEISTDLHLFVLPTEPENIAFGVPPVCMCICVYMKCTYVCLHVCMYVCVRVDVCARRWRLKVWTDYIFVR